MAEGDDLGDLYGDLNDDAVATSTTSAAKGGMASASPMTASLPTSTLLKSPPPPSIGQIRQLEEKLVALEDENKTLKRNMGMLYRTARREIARKDRQISELTSELDRKNS